MMAAVDLEIGFTDPVREAARGFRAVLDAMSQPGRIFRWSDTVPAVAGLHGGAMTVALTLLDQDTPYWLDRALEHQTLRTHLAFHASVAAAPSAEAAAFAFTTAQGVAALAPQLSIGTPEYPDRSATMVVAVDALDGGHSVTLTGPGIETEQRFAPAGLDAAAWAVLKHNAGAYPLGFDTIFAAPDAVAAIPRSTKING